MNWDYSIENIKMLIRRLNCKQISQTISAGAFSQT